MQGYAWSSNQRPMYQNPPPSYSGSYKLNTHQPQFNPQLYTQMQLRHSAGQQEVENNSPRAVHLNPCQYDGQTNPTVPQPPFRGHQLNFNSSSSAERFVQPNRQSCSNVFTQQNYRNAGLDTKQAPIYWTQHADQGRSRAVANDNTKGWSSHISDSGRNQQQLQTLGPANLHHQLYQHTGHQQTQGRLSQSNLQAQNVTQKLLNYQFQGRTTLCYTSHNSGALPPAGSEENNSPASNTFQQRRPELRSCEGPKVSVAQSKNNQNSTGHTNSKAFNINQSFKNNTHRRARTDETQFNPSRPDFNLKHNIDSKLYLRSEDSKHSFGKSLATNTQQSGERLQNTSPKVHSTNRRDCKWQSKQVFSECSLQCVVEPPGKRMKCDEIQRDCWTKLSTKSQNVSADDNWVTSQSVPPDAHQVKRTEQNSTEKRHNGSGQSEVTYSTNPADCLEAVYALQKAFQQVNKAVAIVPPISQQTSKTEQMDDVSPQIADIIKIDTVWSLADVCDSQNACTEVHDKTHVPSPTVEEYEKISSENEPVDNTAGPHVTQRTEICSAGPAAGQNDGLHRNCDSSDAVFELSSVPVIEHTLEELMNLVTFLEMADSPDRYTEKPESVYNQILDLYWNGSEKSLMKQMNAINKVMRCSAVESVKNDKSVVFESITPGNFKKVANCIIVNNEIWSSPKQFRSSWLNIDGQPADMAKLLSDPLPDYITLPKRASENVCVPADNLGVNSSQVSEVTSFNADEQSVKTDSESPKDVFTPCAGNVSGETVTLNKGHSDAEIPGIEFPSHSLSQQKTCKDHGDILENHSHVNTKSTDVSSSADISSEERKDDSTTEMFSQKHVRDKQVNVEQPRDSFPASDSLLVCHRDKPSSSVSDSDKHFKEPFSKIQIKDISVDENSGNMEALNNCTDTVHVRDISDDENSGTKEELINSTDTMQNKSISYDENSGKDEILNNCTDTVHVKDISDDDSDDFMIAITVLSPQDAVKFFHQFEKEPECEIESIQSEVETPDSMKLNSTHVNKTDHNKLSCSPCWDTAPSLDLEIKPCSPTRKEMDVLDGTTKLEELEQDGSAASLEPEVLEPFTALTAEHNADEEPEDDSVFKSVLEKTAEIQSSVEQQLSTTQPGAKKDEISARPQLHTQRSKAHKSAFLKHKLKSGRALIGIDDSELFAPDIVFKKNCPQNKTHGRPQTAVSAISRSGDGGESCSSVKNTIQRKQRRQTPPLQTHTDRSSQNRKAKVREKVSSYSTPLQKSKNTAEIDEKSPSHPVKKNKKTKETIKVRFALFGSNSSHQCVAQGRRFSAPATLTLSSVSQDDCDKLSAKQKVHNQWSNMFISQGKKISSPKSPQNKKRQKPHEALKSNMVALKEHLKNRVMLLSNQEMQKH